MLSDSNYANKIRLHCRLFLLACICTIVQAWKEEGIHLGPTIETFSSGPDDASIFISEDPLEIADRGDFQKVPMMIGHMRQEGLYKMTACKIFISSYTIPPTKCFFCNYASLFFQFFLTLTSWKS